MSTHSSANSTHTNRSASHSLAQSLASLRHSASGGGGSKHRLKPASSITRQENRLGITTDYVDLSLHSAAAKGNVGLVQYALSHGQPVNSVLNGVLPLHAAASSGNETVVKMLIEAGADVNSPRLPRRYTNDRSRTSGLAAGTQGSTPLHFAAANGHVSIIKLLLSYGANPQAAEKHGLLPETIALEQGFIEAADVLRSWQPAHLDRSDRGGGSDDAASIRSRASLHSLTKKRLQAQKSFDAIATKISQHAAHPHLPGLHSSASLASLASLGSSIASPNASSSQISLGAAAGPSSSSSVTPVPTPNRRSSLSHPALGLSKDSLANPRRPSLPSVWEKAAHPRATIRQALGMSKIGHKESDRRALAEAMASRSSLGSAIGEEYALEEEEEDDYVGTGEDEKGEKEERRRSMEVHRPLRLDSFSKVVEQVPSSAPPTQTSFSASDLNSLTSTASTLRPDRSPTLSRAPSASKHELYRPRMSSQLSMDSEADAPDGIGSKKTAEEAKDETSFGASTPSRQRSVSNPQPESRSPLLQQLHQNLLEDAAASASPFLYAATTSATPSPASSRRPSTGATAGLADHELSSDGSNASRAVRPTAADVRKAFSIQHDENRTRADSLASSTSSLSRPPSATTSPSAAPVPAPVAAVQARADANRNRSDSTASSLSTNSFLGGQSNFSYAGTASTAPTSVAPSSPSARAEQFNASTKARLASNLTPLYESKLTHASESNSSISSTLLGAGGGSASMKAHDTDPSAITTRAQARSRVQKAERDLLSYQPTSSRAGSNASSGAHSAASRLSLREQLAQYGKSLALERELAAKEQREESEREKKGGETDVNGGYRIETIGSSSKAVMPSTPPSKSAGNSPYSSPSVPPVPTWRAVPTVDRLMPPPAHVHARQLPSPTGASSRRHHAREVSGPSEAAPSLRTPHHEPEPPSAVVATGHRRASTPTSLTGSTVSAGHGPGGAVLGVGIGGVHFVEVAKDASPHHRHGHHSAHSHTTRVSERSHSDKGTSVTSVRDQVEEERREQERRDASIPKAVLTAGGKKKGIKGWFK